MAFQKEIKPQFSLKKNNDLDGLLFVFKVLISFFENNKNA